MAPPEQPPAPPPGISYGQITRALSPARLAAYSDPADRDSVDAVARYLWNMALAAALTPVLHLVEVAFRNALYEVGCETTAHRALRTRTVPCWLDADPPLLARAEEAAVTEAIRKLGRNTRRHTPGHLISHLSFGFWVRLCDRPYEHGNASGPQLWPRALKRFPHVPRAERTRHGIREAFGAVRDFRNDVAHYQPIWDRNPAWMHSHAIQVLGWMNRHLADVAAATSPFDAVHRAGHDAFRTRAEHALYI